MRAKLERKAFDGVEGGRGGMAAAEVEAWLPEALAMEASGGDEPWRPPHLKIISNSDMIHYVQRWNM